MDLLSMLGSVGTLDQKIFEIFLWIWILEIANYMIKKIEAKNLRKLKSYGQNKNSLNFENCENCDVFCLG